MIPMNNAAPVVSLSKPTLASKGRLRLFLFVSHVRGENRTEWQMRSL